MREPRRGTGRRLAAYLRPHAATLGVAALLVAVVSAARGATVLLVREILDGALLAGDPGRLAAVAGALALAHLSHAAGEFGRTALTKGVGVRVIQRLREELFDRIQSLTLAQQAAHRTGDLMARLTHDTYAAHWAVAAAVTGVQRPLTLAVLLGVAVWQEPRLSALTLVIAPVVALILSAFGRSVRERSREQAEALGTLSAGFQEALAGQRVVKVSGAEAFEAARVGAMGRRQLRLLYRSLLAQVGGSPAVEAVAAVALAAVLWIGGREVLAGRSTPGSLVAFLVSVGLMTEPLKGLAQLQALWQQALAAAERVFDLLDEAPAVADAPGAVELSGRRLDVELRDVSFAYLPGRPVLQGISLEVRAGQVVALVGESGSGKSTLLSLIPRLADATRGSVRIGGRDAREWTVRSLRAHVAVVSQDTFLFDDTVARNVAYGRPDAPRERIEEAARRAHADAFVRALPEGYDTRLGERGERLSGGQRQRVAIARAFLRDAPVLLLDEATSHLDSRSEAEVQAGLAELMRDRTVLVAAHRLSTVRAADRILVLKEGRIVEAGTHGELLGRDGEYARLWRVQTSEPTEVAAGVPRPGGVS